jgi:hypothetical protein
MEVQLHAFVTSLLEGDEWLASIPGYLPLLKALSTHDIRGLLDPRDGPDAMEERMCPCRGSNPGSQVV